jgi:hypothetical protein
MDPPAPDAEEELVVLSNDFIDVAFTNLGGAIQWIALKQHTALDGQPIILNEGSPVPILGLDGWGIGRSAFTVSERGSGAITYRQGDQAGAGPWSGAMRSWDDYQLQCTQTVYHDGQRTWRCSRPSGSPSGTMASIYKRKEERRFVGMAWHTPEPGGTVRG